jgi:3-methyladenine DNA glycosylase/8-oxoguanine DNA glycosylase
MAYSQDRRAEPPLASSSVLPNESSEFVDRHIGFAAPVFTCEKREHAALVIVQAARRFRIARTWEIDPQLVEVLLDNAGCTYALRDTAGVLPRRFAAIVRAALRASPVAHGTVAVHMRKSFVEKSPLAPSLPAEAAARTSSRRARVYLAATVCPGHQANAPAMDARHPGTLVTMHLRGAGGEPVSFRGTIGSHGLAWLPPNTIAADESWLATTLALPNGTARRVVFSEAQPGMLAIAIAGRAPGIRDRAALVAQVRYMFGLDDDLAPFLARLRDDSELAFACDGTGRLLRSATAFEDVVRTICTTNCAWSATQRMIAALVAHLGTPAAACGSIETAPWEGRAFPSAAQIARTGDAFFKDVARVGYRGPYLRAIARAVVAGEIDLEAWRAASREELTDDNLASRLLALPGCGPYAVAHIMMLFGRCSRLVLDSWTRPRYAQLVGKKTVADRTIERRFERYGEHAGRAFWLVLWKSRHLREDRRV